MVTMFEPDESALVPIVRRMVSPQPNLLHTVYRFFAYGFYHYGFPLFAPSAILYKILSWLGQGENMPLVMLTMRQLITVLPMIASLWVLVYMQDQFRSWRSVALLAFLLSVPAVVQNAFWWHPDGLVMLFTSLVLYFLWKDDRQFGRHFYIAAALCGVSVALKVVGLFFFMAIAVILVWGLVEKKLTWKQLFYKGGLFILVMAVAIVFANPYLLITSHRVMAFNTLRREILETSRGYGVIYPRGLISAWPTVRAYYGEAIFLLTAVGVSVWGLWEKEARYLRVLILSWFIPLSIHLLFFSHFKYQYWLPVALALFSNLYLLLPAEKPAWKLKNMSSVVKIALLLIMIGQFGLFIARDVALWNTRNTRAEDSLEIKFYQDAKAELAPISRDIRVYYDYRLYMPETQGWFVETSFDLLSYNYVLERDYDVMFLSHQRIRDYLQPSVEGIDPDAFALAREFYRDADAGQIETYRLLLRDDTVLLFIRQDLCYQYYDQDRCQ